MEAGGGGSRHILGKDGTLASDSSLMEGFSWSFPECRPDHTFWMSKTFSEEKEISVVFPVALEFSVGKVLQKVL